MKRRISMIVAVTVIMAFLCGCGNEKTTKVVLTTGFARDEIFRIGDESCKQSEIMVYLTTIQNQYEDVYGEEIWNAKLDGVTLEENVKDTVLARIARIKTMYLLAKEREISLDEEEEGKVQKASDEFYNSLNDAEKEKLGVTRALIEKMYTEYAMADKVYKEIIKDINPEISDDEARIITAQYIFFSTTMKDGSGKRVEYAEKEKNTVYQEALSVKEQADRGEREFEDLASQFSDDGNITFSFGKGDLEKSLEDAAFNLSTGEISDVLEGENGYYIIKCLNTFDRAETDENKLKIVQRRKDETFGREYDAFVQTLIRNLNEELWDSIEMIRDEEVTTSDFFEIYGKYFS